MTKALLFVSLLVVLLGAGTGYSQDQVDPISSPALLSILEVMELAIVPASDRLWGIEDAPTEKQWQELEQAAITIIVTGTAIKLGGTGPQDNIWAQDSAWHVFADVMADAGLRSLSAIRRKDIDALYEAGDALYPPCEGCHTRFNPAVAGE